MRSRSHSLSLSLMPLLIAAAVSPLSAFSSSLTDPVPSDWTRLGNLQIQPQYMLDTDLHRGLRTDFYAGQTLLNSRRPFDPEAVQIYGGKTSTFLELDRNTTLYAAIDFRESRYSDQYRALDKDFYDTPIAITDTTTGNYVYDGPVIDFLFSKTFLPWLQWGLKLNYGVERGLKDIFTKAEIRELNADAVNTLTLRPAEALAFDLLYRRYSGQMSREMVKEYQDAQIQTWYGETMYRMENPGSSVDVMNDSDGENFGGGISLQSADEGWSLYGGYMTGQEISSHTHENSSAFNDRGLWMRTADQTTLWLRHASDRFTAALLFRMTESYMWGRTGIASSTFMERNDSEYSTGLAMELRSGAITGKMSALISGVEYDYINYLDDLTHGGDALEYRIIAGADWQLSHFWGLISELGLEQDALDFYYNDITMMRIQGTLGFNVYWNFYRVQPAVTFGSDTPSDGGDSNSSIMISVSLLK